MPKKLRTHFYSCAALLPLRNSRPRPKTHPYLRGKLLRDISLLCEAVRRISPTCYRQQRCSRIACSLFRPSLCSLLCLFLRFSDPCVFCAFGCLRSPLFSLRYLPCKGFLRSLRRIVI